MAYIKKCMNLTNRQTIYKANDLSLKINLKHPSHTLGGNNK